MDMNSAARAQMNRWRNTVKGAERRAIRFDERILQRLDAVLARAVLQREALPDWQIKAAYHRDTGHYEPLDPHWRTITVGESWGGKDVTAFFRRRVEIPPRMAGLPVYLYIYVGGDSLLSLNGVPYHGLDPFRNRVLLTPSAAAGECMDIEIEASVHWYTGDQHINTFSQAELVCVDAEVEAAYWDLLAAFKVLFVDEPHTSLKTFLETALWDALRSLPIHDTDFQHFRDQLLAARQEFRRKVYDSQHFKTSGLLHLVGHSHLDIVYQWPHREYIRKVGRTHATMLRLMEQYPEFCFAQSSAKIYADMKEHFPDLYEQVKARIAEGRWQPVGAFWLEPDCNLISGESFVRHILHGQRFWREEFGFQSRVCWQPDVFGMSWALPQILRRSGIEVVLSNKFFVWNDTNPWRKNVFWWEGPDGSKVLAVVPPGHFIGMVDPDHMSKFWGAFSDKETIGEMIYTYGWGDGGGGVDPEMLECAKRYADFPGVTPSRFAQPEDALLRLRERATRAHLPTWRDEMYLEAHRGTYTSKGRLKQLNRQSEALYRQAEMLATLAWMNGAAYPEAALDWGWKQLLFTQFHDALPGTHIRPVYDELLETYAALTSAAQDVQTAAITALIATPGDDNLLVFNSLWDDLEGVVALPAEALRGQSLLDDDGSPMPQQPITALDGTTSVLVDLQKPIRGVGWRVFRLGATTLKAAPPTLIAQANILENDCLRAEFASDGSLLSLWDKVAQREVLAAGERGNVFQLFEDRPGRFDAWDIIPAYAEMELPLQGETWLEVDEEGPLRASLRLRRRFHDSLLTQRISLVPRKRALCFETCVDWHERQRLLKVGFSLAVNARMASYEIAYGDIERPTHRNTPFDAARFEVPAHRWMDMSEDGYGVALLNDCKYGHEAHGHTMRLTLLKGSIAPDPTADIGIHHFTYALLPHDGGWREGGVAEAARQLNTPPLVRRCGLAAGARTFITCEAPNVSLEAVKRSEDGTALVVRLVERYNRRTQATLTFDRTLAAAYACDLMENREKPLTVDGSTLRLELQPREIVTIAIPLL
ncbi:MAG: glycosyl hydrolase-related protein [Anaerolineae bacterium]|nr:glycosyl hydrolase-related protein [Anaerolineae bacterium]MDW8171202.1 glycoside hydrolase family 38 C-terminal domain-containing protein [Anaerolineae bacterium]